MRGNVTFELELFVPLEGLCGREGGEQVGGRETEPAEAQ